MHVSWAVFLIFHLARFSITAAVLIVNETVVFSSIDDCYLPEITFSTIQNRFSLIAFTDEGNETWPLSFPGALHVGQAQLDSPDQDEQWFTTLNLIGGKLITDNRNSVYFQPRNRNPPQVDEYGAVYYPGPRLQSIPPVLEELSYRFDASNASQFWASYSCDAKKNLFLELKTTQGKSHDILRNIERLIFIEIDFLFHSVCGSRVSSTYSNSWKAERH
jgi:hypothetical protein